MTVKRRSKAREAQLAFEALSIEGGLLSPEWLSKVAQLQAGMQAESDYRIYKGLNLRDEIGRYWRIAQANWAEFKGSSEAKADATATAERFVIALLRDAFGFITLKPVPVAVVSELTYPIGYATLGGRVPVVIAPAASGLDTPSNLFGDGNRRRTAFGLAQEYLNSQESSLWGLVSDGVTLRVVRDNASLTRPAWIEADLQRIFTEERYADFAALWLLSHETRFGRESQPATDCALEVWRSAGREQGTRAREHLRLGVEEALVALGHGFLSHPENIALRVDLQNGTLAAKDYFNQLLRLVYRLIFLLTVEERGLLHSDGTSDAKKVLYSNGYGIRHLRERSVKRSAHDRFPDLWEATKVVSLGLATGEPRLGLPALSGIFAASQCPTLDGAKLENRALLLAVFKLAWLREDGSLTRVNWRDMGPEELGSVYESLLELVPQVAKDGRQFAFAIGTEEKGNARKTTGSYYTPDSLVQVLLDSALEPVIADAIAKSPGNSAEAVLRLSVVDPACGSGHFLLAAARRLAAHVARLQANGTPSAMEYRHAVRQVVGRCIFGVDLNPMAVELCKVSLWMEAVEPGLPLTFLNSHIQQGNALLGTTPALMDKGIPDAAWDPIEGDDKKTASGLKRRNRAEAGGQHTLPLGGTQNGRLESEVVTQAVAALDAASDSELDSVTRKEERWGSILGSPEYLHQKLVADAWCCAFVWHKQPGELADSAPTNELWRQLRDGFGKSIALTSKFVSELENQFHFFHWHLQFPQVFATGGFDVVVGNPPWDQMMFRQQEFFASRAPSIAAAATESKRQKMVGDLADTDPSLLQQYRLAMRVSEGERFFVLESGRYPNGARGRVNTFLLFSELAATVSLRYAGLIVPTGLATDDSGRILFRYLFEGGRICRLWDFENRARLFPAVDSRARYCVLAIRPEASDVTDFCFGLHEVQDATNPAKHFTLSPADLALINPNTRTCPSFNSARDADLVKAIHDRLPVLLIEDKGLPKLRDSGWAVITKPGLFNMASDSGYFREAADSGSDDLLAVVEGKMVTFYDHRFADVVISETALQRQGQSDVLSDIDKQDPSRSARPRFWVDSEEVQRRTEGQWDRGWIPGWKEITSPSNARTLIPAILPLSAIGHKIPIMLPTEVHRSLAFALIANLSSFVCDYVCRNKLNGTSLTPFTVKQLPVLPPMAYNAPVAWCRDVALNEWLLPRVLELTYTAWDLQSFARDIGYEGPPFRWDTERRFYLRCELDAAFFRLYGLSKDDVAYVMETFPIVRKGDEKVNNGVYRTKETILRIFGEFVIAERFGNSYRTSLSPPPADITVTHSARGPVLQNIPDIIPEFEQPAEEVAFFILAILHASGGAITRRDLARAFTLRTHPQLLLRFAPTSLIQAREWADKVAGRIVPAGLLADTLKMLADRTGIALSSDNESRSTVTTGPATPAEELLDPWFRFEAQLSLQVLRALPTEGFQAIDESLTGDDLQLLDDGRRTA